MLFLTIPTRNDHPELLNTIIEKSSIPRERVILIATAPNLSLPTGCIIIEDLEAPNIQRWWLKGIEEATRRGASAVAVLNDDLRINEETLPTLYRSLLETGAAVATPTRPDWGAAHYGSENLHPYTPVIWGCLWVLNTSSSLRPDPQYVWWYGDSDLDIRARRDLGGIITEDVYFEHLYSGEGTDRSSSLSKQTLIDAERFEVQYRHFLKQSRSAVPRRLFVQGQQFVGRFNEEPDFRADFHNYVSKVGDPLRDRVVLVEPDVNLHASLRDLWRGWLNVVIVSCLVASSTKEDLYPGQVKVYRSIASTDNRSRVSKWKLDVQRFDPAGVIDEFELPVTGLQDLISGVLPGCRLEALAIDLRVDSLKDASTINPSAAEIIVIGTSSDLRSSFEEARELGLYFTGRPWGEARSSAAFSRSRSKFIRTWRTQAGELVEAATHLVKGHSIKNRSGDRGRTVSPIYTSKNAPEGSSPTTPLIPVDLSGLEILLRNVAGTSNTPLSTDIEWAVEIDGDAVINQRVSDCFRKNKVWPISISIPFVSELNPVPSELISPIIPGYPYSFSDQEAYFRRYSDSYMAVTHRKAGWDCFRHVEILGSGSTPLMIDACEIPEFSMVHYPKDAFRRIMEEVSSRRGRPNWQFRNELRGFVQKHLTSRSMANYLLSVVKAPENANLIFIDDSLESMPDYVSALTAIGLKKAMGQRCVLSPEIPYLYSDTQVDTNLLYGRGFGYSRQLEPSSRTVIAQVREKNTFSKFDYVVVGNVSRNWDMANHILNVMEPWKVILIHGEDLPPTPAEYQALIESKAHVFVRSIH
jgi:hypothetical protein